MDGNDIKDNNDQLSTFDNWMLDGDIGFTTEAVSGFDTQSHMVHIEWWRHQMVKTKTNFFEVRIFR